MKKISIFLIILGVIFLSGCTKTQQSKLVPVFKDHQIVTAQIGSSQPLKLEVVNTAQSINQGLSGRAEVGFDGMLFVFDQAQTPQFWMKEMKFDLDLVWIKDLKIVEITTGVLAPTAGSPLSQLPTYSPSQPVDMVLEVESGKVQDWGLEVGDEVSI